MSNNKQSSLEEETKQNKTTTFVGYLHSDEVLKNGIDLMKVAHGYTDMIHQLTLEKIGVSEENETLKETNKNLLEISEQYKREIDYLKSSLSFSICNKNMYKADLDKALNKIDNLKKENDEINLKINTLLNEHSSQREIIVKLKEELTFTNELKIQAQSDIIGMRIDRENKIKLLVEENEKLKQFSEELKQRSNLLYDKLEENNKLKEENEKLKQDRGYYKNKFTKLVYYTAELKQKLGHFIPE